MKTLLRVAAAVLLLSPGWALAQAPSPADFVAKVAATDMFEVEASKLALERAQSEKVKQFAADMVEQHGKSSEMLASAAKEQGVDLPKAIDPAHQAKLDELRALEVQKFDEAYTKIQIETHTEALGLFDSYSKDGEAGPVKTFALQNGNTIRMHLVRIKGAE